MAGVYRNKIRDSWNITAIVPSQNAIITPVVNILVIFLLNLRVMEKSKTRPVSNYVKPSSTIFPISLAFCFAALIHVEIELHAHRETLKVLNLERGNNIELRNVVGRHENVMDSVLKILQSGSSNAKGTCAPRNKSSFVIKIQAQINK